MNTHRRCTRAAGWPPSPPSALALAAAMLCAAAPAWAGPVNPQVVAGQAQISQPSAQSTLIRQSTDKAIINWSSFNIGAGEQVQFIQPAATSVALNRVNNGEASVIAGQLRANGQVFLVNPSGVLFAPTAAVDVGALVASALDIGNSDFLAGRHVFNRAAGSETAGNVSNAGAINAADGGTVALLGAQVSNSGVIAASLGTIGLVSADKVTLDFNGDGLTRFTVDLTAFNSLVTNGGALRADGGMVVMKASGINGVEANVLGLSGVAQARTLVEREGQILLEASFNGGVDVTGTLDASGAAAGLVGGLINIPARNIHLGDGARIDAHGDAGGGIVMLGGSRTINDANSYTITFGALHTLTIDSGATVTVDGLRSYGGEINAFGDTYRVHGALSARGGGSIGGGGKIEMVTLPLNSGSSAAAPDFLGMRLDASAPSGPSGEWRFRRADMAVDGALAGAVNAVLDTGTSVTLDTDDYGRSTQFGIAVNADIVKAAGAGASLKLSSTGPIALAPGATIASSNGALGIALNSSAASVSIGAGSALRSNGGAIALTGRNSASDDSDNFIAEGVRIAGATIDARRLQSAGGDDGAITITGVGASTLISDHQGGTGVRIRDSSIVSGAGAIRIDGTLGTALAAPAAADSSRGVLIDLDNGAGIGSGAGAVAIDGVGGLAARIGTNARIGSGAALTLSGTRAAAAGPGVELTIDQGALVAAGDLRISGTGGVAINARDAAIGAGGELALSSAGGGVALTASGTGIEAQRGGIAIDGPAGDGVSLVLARGSLRAATGIDVSGRADGAGDGVSLVATDYFVGAGSGISLTGSATGGGDGVAVVIDRVTIDGGAGRVALNGQAAGAGAGVSLVMSNAALNGGGDGVRIDGAASGGGNGVAVVMSAASVNAGAGALAIAGSAAGGDGVAVVMDTAAFNAGAGGLDVRGSSLSGIGLTTTMSAAGLKSAGAVHIEGAGESSGAAIVMSGSSIDAANGALDIAGSARNGSGVELIASGATLTASGGDLRLDGRPAAGGAAGDSVTGLRLNLFDTTLAASGGGLLLSGRGSGAGDGVRATMIDSVMRAGGGDLRIDGVAGERGAYGVYLTSDNGEDGNGAVAVGGVVTGSSARLIAERGGIDIHGVAGAADDAYFETSGLAGLRLSGLELRATGGISLRGSAAGSGARHDSGLWLQDSLIATTATTATTATDSGAPSTITVLGATSTGAPGLTLDGVTLGGAGQAGDIVIGARNAGAVQGQPQAPMIAYQVDSIYSNSVRTSGAVNLRPDDQGLNIGGSAATGVPISVGGGAPFDVAPSLLGLQGATPATLVVGSAEHTGAISWNQGAPWLGDLTLQNGGAGSAGIAINTALRGSGTVTLSSGGTVRSNGAPITAIALLLHGAQPEANFQLGAAANAVDLLGAWFEQPKSTLDAAFGDVNFNNQGALRLWPVSGAAFSASSPLASRLGGGDMVVAGDLLARSGGALTMGTDVRTIGSAITLVAGSVFDNAGGHTLTPGADGNWRVFADTWVGEQRGGLQPTAPLPNRYHCAYGDSCGEAAGNHFIYRQQPLLTLQADGQTRQYGDANPLFTFSGAGLVNGDSLADAASGAYASAPPGAGVGSYAITGNFVSPAGYALTALPANLLVTRAPLLIVADDQSKIYGGADPSLTASYSGFKNNEDAGVVRGLALRSATGKAAGAGIHAIDAQGASADNYAISYQAGSLTVAPAPLLVSADDRAKVYGGADPALGATLSGLQYDDGAGVLAGLVLRTATGAAATAGVHSIAASGASAANYAVSYRDGRLTVAPAPLLVKAGDKAKVYGAAEPVLSATFSGLQYDDGASVVAGLRLVTASGAAAGAGTHVIDVVGGSAANYVIDVRPGTLTVTPAPLLITANDAATRYGEAAPRLSARYDGFVYGDTPAVVSGLSLTVPPAAAYAPGVYSIVAANASAANYAIAYQPGSLVVSTSPQALRPVIARDVTFESSYLYEKNVGAPRMCVGTGPLGAGASASGADLLGLDWSRVRVSPNLSNCLALGQRNSCSDF